MIEPPELSARSVSLMIRGIVVIAVLVVAVQFSQSIFGQQTRWKGGGFGMYTEPHPSRRITWLVATDSAGAEHRVRLWPVTSVIRKEREAQAPDLRQRLRALEILANRRATSADSGLDGRLLTEALAMPWMRAADGSLALTGGTPLDAEAARIEIYEIRYAIGDGVIRAVKQ